MTIKKYKKLSKGKYKITFTDGTELTCYEEVIINNSILTKKELTKIDLEKINKENGKYEAYYTALNYLKTRLRTVKEVEKYLSKKELNKTDINNAINKLTKEGYLNDNNFTKAYINTKVNTTKHGPKRIEQELIKLGIQKDIIKENMSLFNNETKEEKINKYIDKAIETNRKYGSNLLKQKIVSKLLTDGYNKELITNILQTKTIEDNIDILEKEYNKLIKKEKNSYKVRSKLYSLGFNSENINSLFLE